MSTFYSSTGNAYEILLKKKLSQYNVAYLKLVSFLQQYISPQGFKEFIYEIHLI